MTGQSGPDFLAGMPQRAKVAVVRASRIGDFICATPALRALRAALPQAEISLITLPMLQELAVRLPSIDRFIPFPGFPGMASQLFEARRTISFFNDMHHEKFDLAIQLNGSGVYSNPFTLLLGARQTIGFIRPGDLTDRLDGAVTIPLTGHEIERVLAMTDFLGAPRQSLHTDFPLWKEDREAAAQLLEGASQPLIGLHPAANSLTRRWALERFAQTGQELQRQYGGTIVILASAEEQGAASRLAETCGAVVLNLAGKTNLPVLGAVIERLAVLVTNDSGPAHISYALGTPAVVIWGGEDLQRYGPPEGPYQVLIHPVDCRPCNYSVCPIGYVCLDQIHVDTVVEACRRILDGSCFT